MRLLHTSDWHLGVHHGPVSRGPDHDRFLAWLLGELRTRKVDALVIAGDVFDRRQPPAEALRRYYDFLRRVAEDTGVGQVLVVGGNHDSASQLEAPASVLSALSVAVVGGVSSLEDAYARCVVPLRGRDGEVGAVALAVPYVAQFHLGIRTTDADMADLSRQFRAQFATLYRELTERAVAAWPGVPVVATGHMNLGSQHLDEAPERIHLVGNIEALPASVLDPRIAYTALGHIHRCYPVDAARRAWFSGSPIALSLPEAQVPRRALLVDLEPAGAAVTKLEIPAPRALREVVTTVAELPARLKALTWTEPLPPLVFLRVVTDVPPSDLNGQVHEALAHFDADARPAVVDTRLERETAIEGVDDEALAPLADLNPADVFGQLCAARGVHEADALAQLNGAFAQLSEHGRGELDTFIADLLGPA